ncbi:high affinity immunoglobulin epsilon receptor subunit gamma [Denticeps clupeoides]|uniref:Fc epsilon receptor IgFc epsilon receptor Ig n=1 Tax=Denticeps clupeoides TaxID=299321 RepID=A0AAY4E1Z7_9TELE|nr:high affinity immunoglobulin epsilon receptor subunit gamma-like [Denticeps clupeoides]
MKRGCALISALPLWLCFGNTAAMSEPQVCYVLDSILFLYGIVLTVLYCRLKILKSKEKSSYNPAKTSDGIYEGLGCHNEDPYETIKLKGEGN